MKTVKKIIVLAIVIGNCLPMLSFAQQLTGGHSHSLYVCSDGTVRAWGYNYWGQIGNGTTNYPYVAADDLFSPVQVLNISDITDVSGSHSNGHSFALKSDGAVWAWGYNYYGQLGDGTTTDQNTPVQVSGISGITKISAGGDYSLALKNDSTVWGWGNNGWGQLGDSSRTNSSVPVQVLSLTGIIDIAGGASHSLALKSDGTVWSWGVNTNGELGDGNKGILNYKTTPVQAIKITDVKAISAGVNFSLALKNDGTVWGWGANISDTGAVQIPNLTGITAIVGGGYHFIALKSDGTVWARGYNLVGQLGNGTTTSEYGNPVQVLSVTDITKIAAGFSHSMALKSDGTLWVWGDGANGRLGIGATTGYKSTPVEANSPCDTSGTSGVTFDFLENHENIKIFPNPTSDFINISNTNYNAYFEYEIINPFGKIIFSGKITSGEQKINVLSLANGIYILKLKGQKPMQTKLIICN